MDGKKISFSFSKVKKTEKPTLLAEKRDYIDCLEEKSIKIIGGENVEKKDLVIPMKANTKPSIESIAKIVEGESTFKEEKREIKAAVATDTPPELPINDNETLEQRAAREILEDLKNQNDKVTSKVLSVPLSSEIPLTGEKESTLEDYENIPISDFGKAMLRGMGWAPAEADGKNEKLPKYSQPTLRPKGLGLGADKMVKQDATYNGVLKEEIRVKKGAYLKITAGPHSGSYGQISGFDEDSGRLIVELSSKGGSINISEFMVQLFSKNEYEKQCRIINSSKYEEYKKRDDLPESEKLKKRDKEIDYVHSYEKNGTSPYPRSIRPNQTESNRDNSVSYSINKDSNYSAGSKGERRIEADATKSDKLRKYDSSSGSDSSLYSSRNEKKSRRRSQSRSQMVKVERDKKRKGKKKKRDRSRSPNYRKYKK